MKIYIYIYPQLSFLKENWCTESLMNPFTEKIFEYLLHANLSVFLVEVEFIYSVGLVLDVQRSDSFLL